jgi:hypothetical protein
MSDPQGLGELNSVVIEHLNWITQCFELSGRGAQHAQHPNFWAALRSFLPCWYFGTDSMAVCYLAQFVKNAFRHADLLSAE